MGSKTPYILTLTGISTLDYKSPEDIHEERIKKKIESPKKSNKNTDPVYEKLPPTFKNDNSWPTATNLPCWNCTFTFDNVPRFIPKNFREREAKVECDRIGVFCTFNCAMRYILEMVPKRKQWGFSENLRTLYNLITGNNVLKITPSPSRFSLIEYEGHLTRDGFWEKIRELDPVHGLKDHRLGSVVPERFRVNSSIWEVGLPNLGKETPSNPGKEELASSGKEELASSGKGELASSEKRELTNLGKETLSNPGKGELANPGKGKLANSGKGELTNSGKETPSNPGKENFTNLEKELPGESGKEKLNGNLSEVDMAIYDELLSVIM